MTDHHLEDDLHRRHVEPAPIVEPGDIDAGVTPQQAAGHHPAEGVVNQHDLDGDILPVDATADTNRTSPESETSSSGSSRAE